MFEDDYTEDLYYMLMCRGFFVDDPPFGMITSQYVFDCLEKHKVEFRIEFIIQLEG